MILPRSRLLARMLACEPRLVRLCAPPGYGKSSLSRLFARRFARHSFCDCSGVATTSEFAARALGALAGESHGGNAALAQTKLRLHAAQASEAEWSRTLLDAWKHAREHALLVIEHASAIESDEGVLRLIGDLLAARPEERVVLISSRSPLPLRVSHYFSEHQILTLTSDELRFNPREAAGIFEGTGLAPELAARIVALADGWPIVLLLLALYAQYEADFDRSIDRLERAGHDQLHEHLATELLGAFTSEMLSTLLAIAAIPRSTLDDIGAAAGIRNATPIIDRLLHLPGFISSEAGAYQIHPLVEEAVRARHGSELARYLLRAARGYEDAGDSLRAAELYNRLGDPKAAAAALERLPAAAFLAPSAPLIDALVEIDAAELCTHPNLWIALFEYRRGRVDPSRLYGECSKLLEDSPPAYEPLRDRLRVRLGILACELQRLDRAGALFEAARHADSQEEPHERRLRLMGAAVVAAKRGRFTEVDRLLDACDAIPGTRDNHFEAERALVETERARFLGDWDVALKLSEEALDEAQRAGTPPQIIDAAGRVARAAWYCDGSERLAAALQTLEDFGAVGELDRAHALWQDALNAPSPAAAGDLFDRAIAQIDENESDFTRILIRVSAALLLPAQRHRLTEARALGGRVESSPLAASLDLLSDDPQSTDYGIFAPLAARVARSPIRADHARLYLSLAGHSVRQGTETLHVSDRGLELLAALAMLPGGDSKERLAATIWPELDAEAALNALKMCVSRTRAQLRDKGAIRSTKRGYALSDDVVVDVHEFEMLRRRVTSGESAGDSIRHELQRALRALQTRERARTADWAWFKSHESRLDELQGEFTALLAKGYAGASGTALSAGSSRSYRRAL